MILYLYIEGSVENTIEYCGKKDHNVISGLRYFFWKTKPITASSDGFYRGNI